jgi:hypothetical protein
VLTATDFFRNLSNYEMRAILFLAAIALVSALRAPTTKHMARDFDAKMLNGMHSCAIATEFVPGLILKTSAALNIQVPHRSSPAMSSLLLPKLL